MTREEKLASIGKFESSYAPVETLIADLDAAALAYVPPIEGAWSIDDFLVHMADADLSLAFRVRSAVAESGREVPVWDEEAWQARLGYRDMDGKVALALAKAIRAFAGAGLRAIVDRDWENLYVTHPSRGRLDIPALLAMYRDHVAFHLPLIKRNRDAWAAR
jgi:hypothetical protein